MKPYMPAPPSFGPDQIHPPWLGPRVDGAHVYVCADPSTTEGYVMGVPVSRTDQGGYMLQVSSDSDGITIKPLTSGNGWQTVAFSPAGQEAEGFLILVLTDWSPRKIWNVGFAFQKGIGGKQPATQAPITLPADKMREVLKTLSQDRVNDLDLSFIERRLAGGGSPAAPVSDNLSVTKATTPSTLRFAFGSCQFPAGVMDSRPSRRSLQLLASRVRHSHAPSSPPDETPIEAVFLLGDQIYADASYGILDPGIRADDGLERMYEAWLSTPEMREIMRTVKVFTLPDDHEIRDNWEPPTNPTDKIRLEAFRRFQRMGLSTDMPLWGAVSLNGFDAFMLDSRTEREPRPSGNSSAQMISQAQRDAFVDWLKETPNDKPRFVFSSVWPLPRPNVAEALSDTWSGYPASLQWLLESLVDEDRGQICLLSGDAHLAGHTRLQLNRKEGSASQEAVVHLLHAPALYAPFPFANGRSHQYVRNETLSWNRGQIRYECVVDSQLWDDMGDGHVEVTASMAPPKLSVCFVGPHTNTCFQV